MDVPRRLIEFSLERTTAAELKYYLSGAVYNSGINSQQLQQHSADGILCHVLDDNRIKGRIAKNEATPLIGAGTQLPEQLQSAMASDGIVRHLP